MLIDESLSKEKRILFAAEDIFSRYGYEKATLDEIIALADVGKGTVYKYYGNKEQLFYKLIQDKNAPYIKALEDAVSRSSVLSEQIHAYLVEMINFYKSNSNLWRTIYFEMLGGHNGAMVCIENGKPIVKSSYAMKISAELEEQMLRYHAVLDDAFVIMRNLLTRATSEGVLKNSHDVIRTNYFLCGIAMVIFHDREEISKISVDEFAEICTDRFLFGERLERR